ncbi:MAG TPA: hypothetical protein ENK57_07915 [Polyangiaceae bacterium]|nr:hypothetical protein [Polyangiaceae bacterium]
MLIAIVAVVWGCACAVVAWRYPRVTAEAVGPQFERALADELTDAGSDAERVAAANVLLADVERELRAGASTPKLAGGLAVTGVALAVAGGVLVRPDPALAWALLGLVIGVGGALWAGRAGRRAAERARARADERVSTLVGDLYDAEIVLPVRPTRRFRSR